MYFIAEFIFKNNVTIWVLIILTEIPSQFGLHRHLDLTEKAKIEKQSETKYLFTEEGQKWLSWKFATMSVAVVTGINFDLHGREKCQAEIKHLVAMIAMFYQALEFLPPG